METQMRAGLTRLALVLAAAMTAYPPSAGPAADPPANPRQTVRPLAEPPLRSYPPSWYYDPYTQGIVALPQRGGD